MKFKFLLITLLCYTISSIAFAQTEFREGYIVSNQDTIIDCFIRNAGHEESTMNYEYKLKESERINKIELSRIKEFGIDNELKCIRAFIAIDISENTIPDKKNAILEWEEGHVFLKTLFEGELASLYTYYHEGTSLFYYSVGDNPIEPLVYKKYYIGNVPVGLQEIIVDNTFQVQLKENLDCGNSNDAKKVSYSEKDLAKYFANYHTCKNSEYVQLKSAPAKKGHLLIKPGIIYSKTQLSIREIEDSSPRIPFANEGNVSFGLELEYIMPFQDYRWSVFTEANYLSYATDKKDLGSDANSSLYDSYIIDYKSIEIPIGFGINFYANKSNRFYLRAAFAPHFILGSSYITVDASGKEEFSTASRFMASAGYSYKNIGLEFKYYTPQNLTQHLYQRGSDLTQFSLKLSYSFQLYGDK